MDLGALQPSEDRRKLLREAEKANLSTSIELGSYNGAPLIKGWSIYIPNSSDRISVLQNWIHQVPYFLNRAIEGHLYFLLF